MSRLEKIEHVIALSWKPELIEALITLLRFNGSQVEGFNAEYAANGEHIPELRSDNPTEVVHDKLEQAQTFYQKIREVLMGEAQEKTASNLLSWVGRRIDKALSALSGKVYIDAENLVKDIFENTLFFAGDVVAQADGVQLERHYGNEVEWPNVPESSETEILRRLEELYGQERKVSWQVSLGIWDPAAKSNGIKVSLPIVFNADVPPLYEALLAHPQFIEPRANTMCKLLEFLEFKKINVYLVIDDTTRIKVDHAVVHRLVVEKAPLSLEMLQALVDSDEQRLSLAPFVHAFL